MIRDGKFNTAVKVTFVLSLDNSTIYKYTGRIWPVQVQVAERDTERVSSEISIVHVMLMPFSSILGH